MPINVWKITVLDRVHPTWLNSLAGCARIDECQDWANKAKALANYARQSKDDTLRKMADHIQARAIRRCGESLKQVEAGHGNRYRGCKPKPPKIPFSLGPWMVNRGTLYQSIEHAREARGDVIRHRVWYIVANCN